MRFSLISSAASSSGDFFVFGGKAIPSFQHNSSLVAPFKLGLMRLIRPPAIHANTPRNYRLRIPTDRRQTPWLCSSAAEELTQGLQKQIHLIVRAGLELRNFRFQVVRLNHAVSFYEGILFGELTKKMPLASSSSRCMRLNLAWSRFYRSWPPRFSFIINFRLSSLFNLSWIATASTAAPELKQFASNHFTEQLTFFPWEKIPFRRKVWAILFFSLMNFRKHILWQCACPNIG